MQRKIFGRWLQFETMRDDWFELPYGPYNYETKEYEPRDFEYPATFPTEDELLFASYGGGSYEGDATVVYRRGGKLFENNGGHCSCYGLEGQWKPEETSVAALAMKGKKEGTSSYYFLSEHDGEAYIAYWEMVKSLQSELTTA